VDTRVVETMVHCLTLAFISRREYSDVRVAAFMKQILISSLHIVPSVSCYYITIPLLMFVRYLLHRYSTATQQLIVENEFDVITSGKYDPTSSDPELSNVYSTCCWEIALLKFVIAPGRFHPNNTSISTTKNVQPNNNNNNDILHEQIQAISTLKMYNLPADDPMKLYNRYKRYAYTNYDETKGVDTRQPEHVQQQQQAAEELALLYIPFQRYSKPHPLEPKHGSESKKDNTTVGQNKKQMKELSIPANVRFVKPRTFQSRYSESNDATSCGSKGKNDS
jgi:CBF/Mak21 family